MKAIKVTSAPSTISSFVNFLTAMQCAYMHIFGNVYIFTRSSEKFRGYCERNGLAARTLSKLEFTEVELDCEFIPGEI